MNDIPSHFAGIAATLREAIGRHAARLAPRAPRHALVLSFLWTYLLRTLARLERLHARWLAHAQPRQRPARIRAATTTRPIHDPPRPPLPRGNMWLVRVMGHEAATAGSQLQHFLTRTDVLHFLHATPQAGRLLRPLCRLLGAQLPPFAAPRPPKPRAPKPRVPKPPAPPPRHGKYTPAQMRRYSPGKIPGPIPRFVFRGT